MMVNFMPGQFTYLQVNAPYYCRHQRAVCLKLQQNGISFATETWLTLIAVSEIGLAMVMGLHCPNLALFVCRSNLMILKYKYIPGPH